MTADDIERAAANGAFVGTLFALFLAWLFKEHDKS